MSKNRNTTHLSSTKIRKEKNNKNIKKDRDFNWSKQQGHMLKML